MPTERKLIAGLTALTDTKYDSTDNISSVTKQQKKIPQSIHNCFELIPSLRQSRNDRKKTNATLKHGALTNARTKENYDRQRAYV